MMQLYFDKDNMEIIHLDGKINLTYTRKSCHFRSQKESDNEAQDKNRARV